MHCNKGHLLDRIFIQLVRKISTFVLYIPFSTGTRQINTQTKYVWPSHVNANFTYFRIRSGNKSINQSINQQLAESSGRLVRINVYIQSSLLICRDCVVEEVDFQIFHRPRKVAVAFKNSKMINIKRFLIFWAFSPECQF